ncbi:hypothetical protein L2E82_31157 [Cichorium intybus]|uniref:Uncharacterized protein n=1 Tax=Cichorium intybus TaxID=13427 RepID=A0ACB9D292_CICIN|nr:hypothetical protein L2E82_31157 [Cichorium intybus]
MFHSWMLLKEVEKLKKGVKEEEKVVDDNARKHEGLMSQLRTISLKLSETQEKIKNLKDKIIAEVNISESILVNYGSIIVKVRVHEVDGRMFQSSSSIQENDIPMQKNGDEDNGEDDDDGSRDGDLFESSDEESDIVDSGEKTAEKVDGHFENFNDGIDCQIIKDGSPTCGEKVAEDDLRDPTENVAHNEKETNPNLNAVHEQNNSSPINMTEFENHNAQIDVSPKLLNRVSEILKNIISCETPIKDKLEGGKGEVKERLDSDNTVNERKWSLADRRVTRSQSRNNPNKFPKSDDSEIGSFSSDSSKMSTNVSYRLEEIGRKNGFQPGSCQEKVHRKKSQKGESKGNP